MKTRELIKIQSWLVVQRRPFSSAHNVESIFSRQNGIQLLEYPIPLPVRPSVRLPVTFFNLE